MSDLSLRQMRYVVAMADSGSISSAARALDVTQPTLSSSLREAELSLGVTLFLRSRGRPLALTAEGRVLLPEIRRLIAHADDVTQRAQGLAGPNTGMVRVGSLVTIAPVLVPPLLSAFRVDRPDADVWVTTADQQELLLGLRTGDLHMALTYDLNIPTWPFYGVAWLGDVCAVLLIAIRTYRLIFKPELLHDESPAQPKE